MRIRCRHAIQLTDILDSLIVQLLSHFLLIASTPAAVRVSDSAESELPSCNDPKQDVDPPAGGEDDGGEDRPPNGDRLEPWMMTQARV